MARAFWLFSKNKGDGSAENPSAPTLPVGLTGKWTNPGDIVRLQTAAGHEHLLLGGYAVVNDEMADAHYHLVAKINGDWIQITQGAASHDHPLDLSPAGDIIPDWFMLFYVGPNADAVAINAHPQCHIIVECPIDEDGVIGPMDNKLWTAGQLATWHSRVLSLLGVDMPPQVNRGRRLVAIFLGCFLSRPILDETGYRYTS